VTAFARRLFVARRELRPRWPLALLAVLWPMLGAGVLSATTIGRGELVPLTVAAVLIAALLGVVLREVGSEGAARRSALEELETGAVLLTAAYTLIAATGGPHSAFYPLVYAAIAFLTIVGRFRAVSLALVAMVAALEGLIALPHASTRGVGALAIQHLTFAGFFAVGNHLVFAGWVRRLRNEHDRKLQDALRQMKQDARDFRLIASSLPPQSRSHSRQDEEAKMAHAAVETIHEQLFHTLDLLRTALRLHTCALVWCEHDGQAQKGSRPQVRLSVKEISSGSELIQEGSTLGSAGVLTSILAEPKELRLKCLGGRRLPPYYAGPEPVTDLCAVPVRAGPVLKGILCADRTGDRPFDDDEAAVLGRAAALVLRTIEHERTFAAVERSKYEQEQFYRASELLSEALTLEQVYERTFSAFRAIAHFELAVILGGQDDRQRVLAVHAAPGAPWEALAGRLTEREFAESSSLVAMAIKNRHFMPANAHLGDPEIVVFDAQTKLKQAKSVLVLPLIRGDQVLGAVVLASSRPGQYPNEVREMLRVIGHQVGVSVQNARMYESMETRATTDGLTGLTNHRAFQERLSQLHNLSERAGQRYALILTDIDHFKSINDTYGHPVGDLVLKRVAALFRGRARKVDIVARYGGEEFVLVLPDTSGDGAVHFANQLREEIAACAMTCEHGTFKITISMGVAEYPSDDKNRLTLIEKADQALYYCKEHGRNCVRRWTKV